MGFDCARRFAPTTTATSTTTTTRGTQTSTCTRSGYCPYAPFAGRSRPDLYIEWESAINEIFVSHNFSEHKKVLLAIDTFTAFAPLWWNEYCRSYPDYIPTTRHDLKLAMQYKFVPSYYTRDMVKKLQNLKQGNDTVKEYYDALETTLLHSFLEESDEGFMDRFWEGLNCDIRELLIHEKCYPMHRLFRLACKAEQEIKERVAAKTNKRGVHIPRVDSFVPAIATVTPPMRSTSVVVSITSPLACDTSPSSMVTSLDSDIRGNLKGTDSVLPHEIDICHSIPHTSCVRSSIDLVILPAFEDIVAELNLPCDPIHEIPTVLSGSIAKINELPDLSAPNELNVANETCDFPAKSDLDHVQLVRENEELARNSEANSLFSIAMHRPLSLSHVVNKITEITCLSMFNSVYAPDLKFNLIGEYGVDKEFLVHRICITCDDLAALKKNNLVQMLDHFDMTSNVGTDFMPNNLLHVHVENGVTCNLDMVQFSLPSLGWFNDKYCKSDYMHKNFTYICKLSCNNFMWFDSCDDSLASYFTMHGNHLQINMSYVQQLREIKMDDIYIYHAYTLSLLLSLFQKKQRRGRLNFQKREDDKDIISRDTTKIIIPRHIFQVISINNYKLDFDIIRDKNTTPSFVLCRIIKEMYKPWIKMRRSVVFAAMVQPYVTRRVPPCMLLPDSTRKPRKFKTMYGDHQRTMHARCCSFHAKQIKDVGSL